MNPQDYLRSRSGRVIRTRDGYWAFIPAPLPPEIRWSPRLLSSLSSAAHAVGELANLDRWLPQASLFFRALLLREANLSAEIDGKGVPFLDLYLHDCSPNLRQSGAEQAQRILNYAAALEQVPQSWTGREVRLEDICQLQGRLTAPGSAGLGNVVEFRHTQNWLGPPGSGLETATYIPAPADAMAPALQGLEAFLAASNPLPPLIRLGLFHYQFEAIHPFETGNGLLGRFLNSTLLTVWGTLPSPWLHLSGHMHKHRTRYFDLLLEVSQRSAWEDWLEFFFEGVVRQARDVKERVRRLDQLRTGYLKQVQRARNAARLRQVIDQLFAQPVFTVRELQASLGVNFAVAQRYVDQIASARFVTEITGQARNRVYSAAAVISTMEET